MAATGIPFYVPSVVNASSVALSGAKVRAFVPSSAGAPTATPRVIYTDPECTVPAAVPYALGTSGHGVLYSKADEGAVYVVKDSAEVTTYGTVHKPAGIATGSGWGAALASSLATEVVCIVSTYAELTALQTSDGLVHNGLYFVRGRLGDDDGGHGFWRYSSVASDTANAGTILAHDSGTGRFRRQYQFGYFQATWWGVRGNSTNCTTEWNTMWTAVNTLGGGFIFLDSGTVLLTGQATCNGSNITVVGATGFATNLQTSYTADSAFLIGGTNSQTYEVTFMGMRLIGAASQTFFQTRMHRGFYVVNCITTEMSTLIKAGIASASGPAYITEVRGGEHAAYLPRMVVSGVSGTFQVGETITGGTSGATAKIRSKDGTTYTLYSVSTTAFTAAETITGGTSAATAAVTSFSRGSHYINIINSSGGLFIRESLIEGSYDGAVNGVEVSNNTSTTFDQVEIHGNYLARFNRNINAVDVRVGNQVIYDNRMDEALEYAINLETTSSTAKAISAVGWAASIISNRIGSGLVAGKGIRLANARSTVGQDSGDTTVDGVHGQGVSGPLVTLYTNGGGQIRNTTVRDVHGVVHVTGSDLVSVTAGGVGDLPGTSVDGVHSSSTIQHAVVVSGSPNSTFRVGRNITAPSRTGSLLSGFAHRIGELNGSATWNPGDLADGAGETSPGITVTGAALGDAVRVRPPYDLQDMLCSAYVQAADTVEIRIQLESGGANVNLASGTWGVDVIQAG